jgi:hypothetical protein
MADTDNNQSQSNQQPVTPSQPSPQSIPSVPDQSLASDMSKSFDVNATIPSQADTKLASSITMGED